MASGMIAALITCIIGLTAIAIWGDGPLAEEIASGMRFLSGAIAAGLIVDLAIVGSRQKQRD